MWYRERLKGISWLVAHYILTSSYFIPLCFNSASDNTTFGHFHCYNGWPIPSSIVYIYMRHMFTKERFIWRVWPPRNPRNITVIRHVQQLIGGKLVNVELPNDLITGPERIRMAWLDYARLVRIIGQSFSTTGALFPVDSSKNIFCVVLGVDGYTIWQ